MSNFVDTDEFLVTQEILLKIRACAEANGWTCEAGTLFIGAVVSPVLHSAGNVIACRFVQTPDVVGVHVYCHPDDPIASLTLSCPPDLRTMILVRAIESTVGHAIYDASISERSR